jgi:26S proteasome regulatory subunit N3
MDVDIVAPVAQVSIKHGLTEIEIYCYLLVLIFLIDHKKYDEVCHGISSTSSSFVKHTNLIFYRLKHVPTLALLV